MPSKDYLSKLLSCQNIWNHLDCKLRKFRSCFTHGSATTCRVHSCQESRDGWAAVSNPDQHPAHLAPLESNPLPKQTTFHLTPRPATQLRHHHLHNRALLGKNRAWALKPSSRPGRDLTSQERHSSPSSQIRAGKTLKDEGVLPNLWLVPAHEAQGDSISRGLVPDLQPQRKQRAKILSL